MLSPKLPSALAYSCESPVSLTTSRSLPTTLVTKPAASAVRGVACMLRVCPAIVKVPEAMSSSLMPRWAKLVSSESCTWPSWLMSCQTRRLPNTKSVLVILPSPSASSSSRACSPRAAMSTWESLNISWPPEITPSPLRSSTRMPSRVPIQSVSSTKPSSSTSTRTLPPSERLVIAMPLASRSSTIGRATCFEPAPTPPALPGCALPGSLASSWPTAWARWLVLRPASGSSAGP